jgi:ubiquinone/menaquinone biosynthesis C-methylase UbiE
LTAWKNIPHYLGVQSDILRFSTATRIIFNLSIPCKKKIRRGIIMDKLMSNLHFKFLSLGYKFRDLRSRETILKEVNIKPGDHVLDFGCGPGSYILPVAKMVGESGKVYALDIQPMAIESVRKIIKRESLQNVESILSGHETGLPDESVDVVLLYDTFHSFCDPGPILQELHRVLHPEGILSFSDHHLTGDEIISKITQKKMFDLKQKGDKTYSFKKLKKESVVHETNLHMNLQ